MTSRRNLFALGFAVIVSAILPVAKASSKPEQMVSPKRVIAVDPSIKDHADFEAINQFLAEGKAAKGEFTERWRANEASHWERLDKDGIYWLNCEGEVHYIEPLSNSEVIREDMRQHGRIVEFTESAVNWANGHPNPLEALRSLGSRTATPT